jgi:hypothetical protein
VKRAPGLLALLICISCVHKYAVPEPFALGSILRRGVAVYLSRPSDGLDHRGRSYSDSGDWTQAALAAALDERGLRIISGPKSDSFEAALAQAECSSGSLLVHRRTLRRAVIRSGRHHGC